MCLSGTVDFEQQQSCLFLMIVGRSWALVVRKEPTGDMTLKSHSILDQNAGAQRAQQHCHLSLDIMIKNIDTIVNVLEIMRE